MHFIFIFYFPTILPLTWKTLSPLQNFGSINLEILEGIYLIDFLLHLDIFVNSINFIYFGLSKFLFFIFFKYFHFLLYQLYFPSYSFFFFLLPHRSFPLFLFNFSIFPLLPCTWSTKWISNWSTEQIILQHCC